MTKDEALRLALEALESGEKMQNGRLVWIEHDISLVKQAITAIKAALEAKDESEYYGLTKDHLWMSISKEHYDRLKPEFRMACYTAPPQQEAKNEPVSLIESLNDAKPCCGQYETCWRACTPRGKFIGQRDAQRTWVGLTDEEFKDAINDKLTPECIAIAIEAKLKEKNG